MAVPDPNGDLIRAMLERRAGQPAPDGVLDRVMRAAATGPQERGGHGRARRRGGPSASTVLVAALATAIVGLLGVIVVQVAAPWPDGPDPGASSGVAAATATGDPGPAGDASPSGDPGAPAADTPGGSPAAVVLTLAPDRMAVVTQAGKRLRVRSAPNVGDESAKFSPLLPEGTRMYIVGGPVHADGYIWYQVQVLDKPAPLFGWVATGKDGKAWIRPDRPRCPESLDVQAFEAMAPLDFLACYGSAEVTLEATLLGMRDTDVAGCPLGDPDRACDTEPSWMLRPRIIEYRTANGFEGELRVAVPPALEAKVSALAQGAPVSLTVAMDHPDARTCRAMEPGTRKDAAPQDQAITRCRATYVAEDIARATLSSGT